MATPNLPNLNDPLAWLKDSQGNSGLNNGLNVDFLSNPDDLLQAGLTQMGQNVGNPFTKYLASNLGGGALQTLYQLVAPPNVSANPNDFAAFGKQLLNSFYNPGTQAPSGLNFGDPNLVGNVLSGLINQTGDYAKSTIGGAFSAGSGIDAATAHNEVSSLIDTLGGFNMSSLARTIAKNQLDNLWGQYLNSPAAAAGGDANSFRQFLAGAASDWLYRNFGVSLGGSSTSTGTGGNNQ